MTLPLLRVPATLPLFRNIGHTVEEDDVFATIGNASGHNRRRRVKSIPPRTVSVSWRLSREQMAVFDAWFEDSLVVGKKQFAVPVRNDEGEGITWWTGAWLEVPKTDPMPNGRWSFEGTLLLTGEPTNTPPDTEPLAIAFSGALVVTATNSVTNPLAISFSAALEVAAAVSVSSTVSPTKASLAFTGYAPTVTTQYIPPIVIQVACSDETTPITTGQLLQFPVRQAMTLRQVVATLNVAATGGPVTIQVKKNGVNIFSTDLTIDANELTSSTAAIPPVIATSAFAVDDVITIHVTTLGGGAAKGLKVDFVGTPVL